MELRSDINALIRQAKATKPIVTRQELKLKKDKDSFILTAEKEVAMVVMDREEYVTKPQELLAQPAYRLIPRDPTNKIKAQLITKLRKKLKRTIIWMRLYIKLCILLVASTPSFMGYPKPIKQAILLGQ